MAVTESRTNTAVRLPSPPRPCRTSVAFSGIVDRYQLFHALEQPFQLAPLLVGQFVVFQHGGDPFDELVQEIVRDRALVVFAQPIVDGCTAPPRSSSGIRTTRG